MTAAPRRRADAALLALAVATGCGGSGGPGPRAARDVAPGPGRDGPTAVVTARPTERPSGDGSAASPGRATDPPTARPDSTASRSPAAQGSMCRASTALCPTAAAAVEWWYDRGALVPPAGVPHSYVVTADPRADLRVPPSPARRSRLLLVVHHRGATPWTTPYAGLAERGAVVVTASVTSAAEPLPDSPAWRRVRVRGADAVVTTTTNGRTGAPVRLVTWRQDLAGVRIAWSVTDDPRFRPESALVRLLDSFVAA